MTEKKSKICTQLAWILIYLVVFEIVVYNTGGGSRSFSESSRTLADRILSKTKIALQVKFWKTGQKRRFWVLFGKFLLKNRVFWSAPLIISLYWSPTWRLYKNVRVGQPKIDFLKSTKGKPFGSTGCRIPEGEAFARPLLNSPLYNTKVWEEHIKDLFWASQLFERSCEKSWI